MEAGYNSTATVNRSLRAGDLDQAELYAEVLVVIVRELKSRE